MIDKLKEEINLAKVQIQVKDGDYSKSFTAYEVDVAKAFNIILNTIENLGFKTVMRVKNHDGKKKTN